MPDGKGLPVAPRGHARIFQRGQHLSSSVTKETRFNMGKIAAEQVLAALDGKPIARNVNPQVWPAYTRRFTRRFGFDQILADVPAGNGDPSLAVLGGTATPNMHNVITRFPLLDNFYDPSRQSAD